MGADRLSRQNNVHLAALKRAGILGVKRQIVAADRLLSPARIPPFAHVIEACLVSSASIHHRTCPYDGDYRLILAGDRNSKLDTLHLSNPKRQDVRKVALPLGTETVFEVKANPQGDRIAWYVGRGGERPTWVERLLRMLRIQVRGGGVDAPSVDTEGIWILVRMDQEWGRSAKSSLNGRRSEWDHSHGARTEGTS